MLYILFSAIILLPVFMGIGALTEKIFNFRAAIISLEILLGIMTSSLILTVLAFFIPVNIYTEIFALLIGLSAFFFFRNHLDLWNFISQNKMIFFPVTAAIIFAGSFYPFILDHFGYYIPTINWIRETGLVKGISNLDLLLGQMSVWHILQAGISSFSDPFLRLNTLLLIIFIIYTLEKKTWIHLLFVPVLFLFSQSPSPDLPAIVVGLILLNEIFSTNRNAAFLFALSCFVFAVKPTMIWAPIFTFCYLFLILKTKLKTLIPGILIIAMFCFKNIWTFGYPVFPVQIGDLGLKWKPNPQSLKISSEVAIQKTFDMQYTVAEIEQFSPTDYIKNWLTLSGLKSVINIAFLISLAAFAVFVLMKKRKTVHLLFISVLIKSILVLLFSAQYRFFIDVFFVVAFVILFQNIQRRTAVGIFSLMSLSIIILLSSPQLLRDLVPSFRPGSYMMGFNKNQFLKPSYFELNRYKTYRIGNLDFNVVKGYPFTFDTPLPAITPQFLQEDYDAEIFPQKAGASLKDGFIWRKMTDAEHRQLKTVLDELKKN